MRAHVTKVAVVATVVAMTVFALPLAFVIRSLLLERELSELEVIALASSQVVPDHPATDPTELQTGGESAVVTVYGTDGHLVAGNGPSAPGPMARRAATGHPERGSDGARLVAAVPVIRNEQVVAVVEAAESQGEVWRQVALAWSLLVSGIALALAVGVLVARNRARRLTAPLEQLTAAAIRVREGDLSARARPGGVAELDELASAHNAMVDALSESLERERRFSANASHQLRTPLARLQLQLEAAGSSVSEVTPAWIEKAQAEVRYLQDTVTDVLQAARAGAPQRLAAVEPLATVLAELEERWRGTFADEGRRIECRIADDVDAVSVAARVLGHIGDVLVENALIHGRGRVVVHARSAPGAIAVDVTDEGMIADGMHDPFARGITTGDGTGVGLSLARTMASAIGARLVLSRRDPTCFTLFFPESGSQPGAQR